MDLELTDEQTWLSESIDTLLTREWVPAERVADAGPDRRRKVWDELVAFGLLAVRSGDGLGAVELCLVARSIGRALASVPSIGSTAIRLALEPFAESLPQTIAESLTGDAAIALALLEPGCGWESDPSVTAVKRLAAPAVGFELRGEKVAIEQLEVADRLAVFTTLDDEPALALADAAATGCVYESQPSFDLTVPIGSARFDGVSLPESAVLTGPPAREALSRVRTIGGLLAAAEAVGAAGAVLEGARRYAGERRQFGRAISSFQSLRHMLADMYVRQASGWSTVLYAAAAFDDDVSDAAETASVAKAYVSRAAREVAHGAMQVFGGIAFTAEHPAHLYLRRILVREQQFGDASHHERVLGRALAARTARPQPVLPGASAR